MKIPAASQKEETIVVGMGEIQVSRNHSTVLACLGLGCCIAVCAYDPVSKVGGMAHIVLPYSDRETKDGSGKYANTAVPLLLQEMAKQGGARSRLIVKLVGGAQLPLTPGLDSAFKTGESNMAETEAALVREKIAIAAADTGGNKGRSVRMFLDTGKVIVKTKGGEGKEL
jgi:chemotaxis protein CheD